MGGGGGWTKHPYRTILGVLTFNREQDGRLGLSSGVSGAAGEGSRVLGEGLPDVQDGCVALHEHLRKNRDDLGYK